MQETIKKELDMKTQKCSVNQHLMEAIPFWVEAGDFDGKLLFECI